MAESQTTSDVTPRTRAGVDLLLQLRGSGTRAGLTEALRDAVRSGHLPAGTRLPASRALAADLGIARSTVTECYSILLEEGWLTARHGSGTFVADRVQPRRNSELPPPAPRRQPSHGLGPGAAEYADFPRSPWLAAARRAFAAAPHSAFGYGDPLGRMQTRAAIAEYLARVRGVYAEPGQIVLSSGYQHGLGVVARALKIQGHESVAMESYGLDIYRGVLGDAELRIPTLEVDEEGAQVHRLHQFENNRAVLLTPAHQFPTGHALSPERRAVVLDWARSAGGLVLEDDYDGEFRYDRKPIGALQGLDPDRVVYFGTASKSIAPALRLGWIVVPEHLLGAVADAKGRVDTVSVLDQLVFTEFVTSGAFDGHIRSRRQSYRRRRVELVDAVQSRAPGVHVIGMQAGLQAVLILPEGTEAWVLQAAARRGLLVSGLSAFRHPGAEKDPRWSDGLVVNFSAVSDSAWPGALEELIRVLP
jgi:GntR family transcriptional regulator/MocR family aminotransferase